MNLDMMVSLNAAEYRDKVYACWLGKNIGGTMGAPYEGTKDFLDVQGFASEAGAPLPNDDLDLQLVWLAAVERCGFPRINAQTLGEFWLSFISPHWNEYGVGKANMKMGLLPPLSGDYQNSWKHSNGAWIRSEIWACLNPARPDLAAKFAVEDACVDHGTGEGTNAAIFVAAMQSAAFVLPDVRECISVALSKLPKDCRVAQSVRLAIKCYDDGIAPREARDTIQKSNADIGDGWFEAPSNVAYTVLGLLYGEGDFKKSMIYAINCGDDTDCTAATVGATLGILYGTKALPKDWCEHIGDEIVTVSIDKGTICDIPKTCTELTERVVKQATIALQLDHFYPFWDIGWERVQLVDGPTHVPQGLAENHRQCPLFAEFMRDLIPYSVSACSDHIRAVLSAPDGIDVKPGEEIRLRLRCVNNSDIASAWHVPARLSVRWWLPDGCMISGQQSIALHGYQPTRRPQEAYAEAEYVLHVGESITAHNRIVAEITANGRAQALYIPVVLMG
jgi:hypothetical protein